MSNRLLQEAVLMWRHCLFFYYSAERKGKVLLSKTENIFGLNMAYIKGNLLDSQFSADWASILLVTIEWIFF